MLRPLSPARIYSSGVRGWNRYFNERLDWCCVQCNRGVGRLRSLFAPHPERIIERAFARRALFDRDDGAALIGVDQRHIEPGTFLQELDVALTVGIDVRQSDQEEAIGDLDREARERCAARLLVGLHQDARYVADAAAGEVLRQDEGKLRGVARRQRRIRIAAE